MLCLKGHAHNPTLTASQVELIVNTACRSDLRYITVNGERQAYSWQFYSEFTSLKFTGLSK